MPVYEYQCSCGRIETAYRKIDDRHDGPVCHGQMQLKISAVRGYVENIEYQSPIDNRPITSKRARREDLERNGCREWEGLDQERKHAARCKAEEEKQFDAQVDNWVNESYRNLPDSTKAAIDSIN